MSLSAFFRSLLGRRHSRTITRKSERYRPALETLEHRLAPAMFTVTNFNNAGPGSLRQAILGANLTPAADTITFAASMANKTITLTGGELLITKPVTIVGLGSTKLTIDGNNASRIFNVDDGAGTNIAVSISGLKLTKANGATGGAIINSETLTLTNMNLVSNTATGSGGGIFNTGTLTVKTSTFSANVAPAGGGIANAGTVTVVTASFLDNISNGANGGGAIRNDGSLTITNALFTGNHANAGSGGGVFNNTGTLALVHSTLSGNTAFSNGGGILNNGTLTLTSSNVSANHATGSGGGIFNHGAIVVAADAFFSGNDASIDGGGIYSDAGTVSVSTTTFFANHATGDGGALYNKGVAAILANATFTGNSALSSGGGVYNFAGAVTGTLSIFSDNSAGTDGGGVLNLDELNLTGVTLSGNLAGNNGGGIASAFGATALISVTVSKNTASTGGGIYASNETLGLANSTVSANTATNGGGLFAFVSAVNLINSTVSGNSADENGGGIDNTSGSTLVATNSTIVGNRAKADGPTGVGGGVHNDASTLGLFNSIVAGNLQDTSDSDLAGASVDAASAFNLIGDPASSGGMTDGSQHNIVGKNGATFPIAQILDPTLRNHGGATLTHAPIPGSAAIDAGDDTQVAAIPFDQRDAGFPRIVGAHVDIGAFEMPREIFNDNFDRTSLVLGNPWVKNAGALGIVGNTVAQGTGTTTVHVATLAGLSVKDADLYAKVTLVANQQAGLVARYLGAGDKTYYLASLTTDASGNVTAKIVRNLKGVVTTLAQVGIATPGLGVTGVLRFLVVGSSLQLYLDGSLRLATLDASLITGSVGLRTVGATPVDDFKAFPISTGADYIDLFNRPDNTALTTPWTNTVGGFRTLNDQAQGSAPINVAILNGVAQADVDLQASVDLTGVKQSAGLIARYQGVGDRNYYLAKLTRTSTGFTAQILSNVKGVNKTLATVNVLSNEGNAWIRFLVTGTNLRFYVDNLLVANVMNATFTSGSVGIRADALATIDSFHAAAVTTELPFTDSFTQLDNAALNLHWTPRLGGFKVTAAAAVGTSTKTANIATLVGVKTTNVEVSADINVTTVKNQVGLLASYSGLGDRNYYMAAVTKLKTGFYLSIVRNVNGIVKVLKGVPVPALTGPIKFRVQGTSLTLLMNNVQHVAAVDGSLGGGGVGVRTVGTGVFDNFKAATLTATLFEDNFDQDATDPNWITRVGEYGNDDPHEYAKDKTIGFHPLNLQTLGRLDAADVDIQTQIDVVAALNPTEHGALVARYSGAGDKNMYLALVSYSKTGFILSIAKKVNGVTSLLASAPIPDAAKQNTGTATVVRGTLRFTVIGGAVTVFFTPTETTDLNPTPRPGTSTMTLTAFDFSLKNGSVGIRSSLDTIYDNFKVNASS